MPARHFCRLVCAVMALCLLLCACAQPAGADAAPSPEPTAAASARPSPTPRPDDMRPAGADAEAAKADDVPTVLPETADAGRSYVDGTLFIGDSNTARYMMYADDTGKAFTEVGNTIGVVSMGAEAITTLKCERFKGHSSAYTIPDAVAMLKPQRILIGFGTNNLAGYSTENFIKKYREGLAAIAKAWEYADIIVCAVPPLDYQRENTNLTMNKVDAYNTALAGMCEEDGYHFLNTAEVLKDASTGWAKKDYTLSDGVHLSKTAVTALFGYIRTHALTTADRRPKDLGTIPTPDGVPPGLIQKDPIAVRGAKVPVEFVATNGGRIQGYTSQKVKKGGTCSTVTAVPNEGWAFSYWTASIGSVGSSASLTFTVPGSADANGVIVTAHFTPAEHEHEYVELSDTRIEPTCEQDGGADYQCTICGDVIEKSIPRLGHAWDSGVVTQAPTTAAPGVMTFTCQRDSSHIRTELIQQLAPTPTPPPAHTHDFSVFMNNTATCTAGGTLTMKCSGCEQTQTSFSAPKGHTQVTQGDGSVVCAVCGALLQAAPAPTPHVHDYSVPVGTIPATCVSCGKVIYQCSADDAQTTVDDPNAPATGVHTAGAAVQEGAEMVTRCTVCGFEMSRTPVQTDGGGEGDAAGDMPTE